MESREVEKKTHAKGIITLVIFLGLIVIITILFLNLFGEKVTNNTVDNENTTTTSIYCTTNRKDISGAFFDFSDTESVNQAMKVIFKNKKIDNISYTSTAIYKDESLAKGREGKLIGEYGLFMQDNGKEMTDYSPNFSTNGTEVKISLFATMKQLNNVLAKIFLINTNDALSSYSPNVLAALYKEKGFDCEINE